jgi:predicted O-methyltransferase YrrM
MRSLIHFLRFTVGLDSPSSQVTEDELHMLMQYSRGAAVICELGCYEGRSSVAFALNTSGAVYAVDPFLDGRLGVCYTEWVARIHRRRQRAKNLLFLRGLSGDVVRKFHRPIDFLFIDADHSYEAAKADWEQWFPKVNKNGYIALHDAKLAKNSSQPLGSMRFYSEDLARMTGIVERNSVDSLVIVQNCT